ncbi:MAG: type II toxin-antitoxin system Phd/YefM family antitoxin [Verrucomicrobia bacterium]|nr:type II toxin-antitoxin system Phd/YefM family antitoxin [Verrucomicrobiota bacterium]
MPNVKTLSVNQAKDSLDEVLDEALAGETIVILHHNRQVLLQPCLLPEPIPRRPPGFFDDCYADKSECELENRCGHASD